MARWDVVRAKGDARGFHSHGIPDGAQRSVRLLDVSGSALALGSTQSIDDVDLDVAKRLDVDVFNRQSGGGAVLLDPGAQLWVDVVIGRSDSLWSDDVSLASQWLGDVWVTALHSVGIEGVVHRGAMVTNALSPVVCFAGLAAGEVTVDGTKVVGISQRRTRAGARFQCSVPLRWDASRHAELLAPGIAASGGSIDEVRVFPATLGDPAFDLRDAFIEALP
jgi:lipoate-protein ligase A